jgi:hypothetical protein
VGYYIVGSLASLICFRFLSQTAIHSTSPLVKLHLLVHLFLPMVLILPSFQLMQRVLPFACKYLMTYISPHHEHSILYHPCFYSYFIWKYNWTMVFFREDCSLWMQWCCSQKQLLWMDELFEILYFCRNIIDRGLLIKLVCEWTTLLCMSCI